MSAYAYAALAGLQLWSGLQQAQMIRETAALNSEINELNAKFIELDALEAETFGFTETAAYQSVIDRTIGEQRAAMAAADIDLNYGTAADIQAETKFTGFLNQIDLQNQARAKALGLRREARNVRLNSGAQSLQASMNASATQTSSILSAINTGISAYARK